MVAVRWRCGGGVGGAGVQEPTAGHTGPYSGHSSTPPPPPPPPLLPPPPPPPPPHHLHSHPRTTLHSPPPLFTGKLMILAEIPQTRPDLTIDLKQILQLPWTRPHTTEPPGPWWPGGRGGPPAPPRTRGPGWRGEGGPAHRHLLGGVATHGGKESRKARPVSLVGGGSCVGLEGPGPAAGLGPRRARAG